MEEATTGPSDFSGVVSAAQLSELSQLRLDRLREPGLPAVAADVALNIEESHGVPVVVQKELAPRPAALSPCFQVEICGTLRRAVR
jgi:hypothetical protein